MATQQEAARHIDLSGRRFRQLIEDGVVERRASGAYDLRKVRVDYIRHLRGIAASHGGDGAGLAKARAALTQQLTEAASRKNELARGTLVDVGLVKKHVERDHFLIRESLLNLPGALADDLVEGDPDRRIAIESKLTTAIHDVLTALSSGDEIARAAAGKGGGNGSNGNGTPHPGSN